MSDAHRPDEHQPHIGIEHGNPTDVEIAALVAALGSISAGPVDTAPLERNLWGHPVDKLRYPVFSWQLMSLRERLHLRR